MSRDGMQLKEFSLISSQVELGTVLKALETAIPTEAIETAIAQTHSIALRIYVRTEFEGRVDTITKALEFIPPLSHPILEYEPPTLNQVLSLENKLEDTKFRILLLLRLGVTAF